jgi:hypothetical protein
VPATKWTGITYQPSATTYHFFAIIEHMCYTIPARFHQQSSTLTTKEMYLQSNRLVALLKNSANSANAANSLG